MSQDHNLLNSNDLSPATLKRAKRLPVKLQELLDRWMAGDPKAVLAMESQGTLFQELEKAAERESEALDRLAGPEYSHLTDREKLELVGPPTLP